MKKVISILVLSFLFFTCEGPQGPPGRDGFDGGLIVSSAFEIEIDFNAANNYEYFESYGFTVYPSDVVMVYISWETDNGQDIWRALPQTTFFNEGALIYNFDFTQDNVRFFLDGDIDFSLLGSEWTQNQVFRVVVIPAENVDGLDLNNYNQVIETLNIQAFKSE
ncbi:hypothetical protein [Aestuariibaculum suncheonense]|uniref:Dihydrolipoamide dehydrogenase n=1 Tax=Aestuariibaculum suncheonense TaxID=1028745 RepID=A0A8J6UB26_9FLAO|nr:hypothetical protein [Aestuariibaculum suncheonense]MBD0835037.1 hypothetical protein [Aestuariibaculum suncheonense]